MKPSGEDKQEKRRSRTFGTAQIRNGKKQQETEEELTHTRLIMTLLLCSFVVVEGKEAGAVKTGGALTYYPIRNSRARA
jgi:hypothetical protein